MQYFRAHIVVAVLGIREMSGLASWLPNVANKLDIAHAAGKDGAGMWGNRQIPSRPRGANEWVARQNHLGILGVRLYA